MSRHDYYCKGGSFDYDDLEIEWTSDCYAEDLSIEFQAFTPCGRDITDDLSDVVFIRIMDECWNEYWRMHA